jgi:hypothetical protein
MFAAEVIEAKVNALHLSRNEFYEFPAMLIAKNVLTSPLFLPELVLHGPAYKTIHSLRVASRLVAANDKTPLS